MQTSNQVVDEVVWSVPMMESDFKKLFYENPLDVIYNEVKYHSILKYDPRVVLMTEKMGIKFDVLLKIACVISNSSKKSNAQASEKIIDDNEIVNLLIKSMNSTTLNPNSFPPKVTLKYSDSIFSENIIDKINSTYSIHATKGTVMNKVSTLKIIGNGKRFKNSFEFLNFIKDMSKISPLRTHFVYKKVSNMNDFVLSGSSGSPSINVMVPFDKTLRMNEAGNNITAIYPMISKIRMNNQDTKYKSVYRRDINSNTGYFHFDIVSSSEKNTKEKYFELMKNPFVFSGLIKMMKIKNEIATIIDNKGTLQSDVIKPKIFSFDSMVCNLNSENIPDIDIETSSDPINYQLTSAISSDGCPTGMTYQICVKSGIALDPTGTSGTIIVVDGSGWCGM